MVPVPGYAGLYASAEGVIYGDRNGRIHAPAELAVHIDRDGYRRVQVRFGARRLYLKVARLVCLTFNGPAPSPRHEVRHLDGNRTSDGRGNLAWGTHRENIADMIGHGRLRTQRIQEHDVPAIRERAASGEAAAVIATAYGVSPRLIRRVIARRTWAHIGGG